MNTPKLLSLVGKTVLVRSSYGAEHNLYLRGKLEDWSPSAGERFRFQVKVGGIESYAAIQINPAAEIKFEIGQDGQSDARIWIM